jgi:hypothetical protein
MGEIRRIPVRQHPLTDKFQYLRLQMKEFKDAWSVERTNCRLLPPASTAKAQHRLVHLFIVEGLHGEALRTQLWGAVE